MSVPLVLDSTAADTPCFHPHCSEELLALCLLGSGNSVNRVLPSQCRRRLAQLALDTPRLPRLRSHPNSAIRRIHPYSFRPYATAVWAWL